MSGVSCITTPSLELRAQREQSAGQIWRTSGKETCKRAVHLFVKRNLCATGVWCGACRMWWSGEIFRRATRTRGTRVSNPFTSHTRIARFLCVWKQRVWPLTDLGAALTADAWGITYEVLLFADKSSIIDCCTGFRNRLKCPYLQLVFSHWFTFPHLVLSVTNSADNPHLPLGSRSYFNKRIRGIK